MAQIPEKEYRVTVGDLCMAAIGLITNRIFPIFFYTESMDVAINSPVHNPRLARNLRMLWATDDFHQAHLDWLLRDFYTRGTTTYDLQRGAARRLLYYYPEETKEVVRHRLMVEDLPCALDPQPGLRNQWEFSALIHSISWCDDPQIRSALDSILAQTTDAEIILACARKRDLGQRELLWKALNSHIAKLPDSERSFGPFGKNVLIAAIDYFPDRVIDIYEEYLNRPYIHRRDTLCSLIREFDCPNAPLILPKLLDDRRQIPSSPLAPGSGIKIQRTMRICDRAASVLASCDPALNFPVDGSLEERDTAIKTIIERLRASGQPNSSP